MQNTATNNQRYRQRHSEVNSQTYIQETPHKTYNNINKINYNNNNNTSIRCDEHRVIHTHTEKKKNARICLMTKFI